MQCAKSDKNQGHEKAPTAGHTPHRHSQESVHWDENARFPYELQSYSWPFLMSAISEMKGWILNRCHNCNTFTSHIMHKPAVCPMSVDRSADAAAAAVQCRKLWPQCCA